jgi:type I restriction enzyme M protein
MTAVTHDIVAKLWNLCNVLKDDGVTYHQYVTELTYPLRLQMIWEIDTKARRPRV